MLRPWNNIACLYVDPQYVTARLVKVDKTTQTVRVPLDGDHPPEGVEHEALLAAIQDAITQLAAVAANSIRTVHVEIADAFAFYDIFSIDARTLSDAELQRIAVVALADTFGLDPAMLNSRCAVQPGERSVVTCAMPASLIAAINRAIRSTGRKPGRITPAFAAFLNRHREALSCADAIVARMSGDYLVLGLLGSGTWQAFSTERMLGNSWQELHAKCDAFSQRLCVTNPQGLPVWVEGDVQDVPDGEDARWHRFSITPERMQEPVQ